MRRKLAGARRVGTGRAHHPLDGAAGYGIERLHREIEAGLPAADQLQIDRRQELGIEAGAVLAALGEIDGEAAAERVEGGGGGPAPPPRPPPPPPPAAKDPPRLLDSHLGGGIYI